MKKLRVLEHSGRLEEKSEKLFPSTQLVDEKLWRKSGQHYWPNIRVASMHAVARSTILVQRGAPLDLLLGTNLLSQLGFCAVLPQEVVG